LLLAVTLPAQRRTAPVVKGGFGNVVFPGGTAANSGVRRNFGNVVFPGTGGPQVKIPFSITDPTFGARLGANVGGQNVLRQSFRGSRHRGAVAVPFAVPVYVGGYGGYYDAAPPPVQQPNITVIYPPQPAPVIINQYGPPEREPEHERVTLYQAPSRTTSEATEGQSFNEPPPYYLIAFKDNTIYSAVAYWVDGDTLHYFTSGNTHNQVSVSLVDKALTQRLNREKGMEVRLP
jgi:hypothetical protein